MKHIVVITTGGTIGLRRGPKNANTGSLVGDEDFRALLPRDGITISVDEHSNVPGSHLTPVLALGLSRRVEAALMNPDVAGVVISHGLDTLEETAYLLDLTLKTSKPVVLTGATRNVAYPAYDGLTNLAAAIRVAAVPESRDLGVLIVCDDEIHAASEAQMVHTQSRSAFASPNNGPLGRVEGERVWLQHRPIQRMTMPCVHLEEMVDLLRLTQGADDRMLRHSIEDGVAGIVIEAFGAGRVPPWWLPTIGEAVRRRIVVVVTSRCLAGSLGDEHGYVGAYHDLRRVGALFAHNLSGTKARIKLMVALGAARSPQELRAWF